MTGLIFERPTATCSDFCTPAVSSFIQHHSVGRSTCSRCRARMALARGCSWVLPVAGRAPWARRFATRWRLLRPTARPRVRGRRRSARPRGSREDVPRRAPRRGRPRALVGPPGVSRDGPRRENPARDVVLACSALRARHRDALRTAARADRLGVASVHFILLDVPRDVLAARLAARRDHFFDPSLLDSQLATLEPGGTTRRRRPRHRADLPSPTTPAGAVQPRPSPRRVGGGHALVPRPVVGPRARRRSRTRTRPDRRVIDHARYRCGTESEYRETIASLEAAGHASPGARRSAAGISPPCDSRRPCDGASGKFPR